MQGDCATREGGGREGSNRRRAVVSEMSLLRLKCRKMYVWVDGSLEWMLRDV